MSVFNRTYLSDILHSSGVNADDKLLDKVMDFQRVLQVRFQERRCPPYHTAVVIELACREMKLPCCRAKVLTKLGLKTPSSAYRQELVLCEGALGLKRSSNTLIAALSINYGIDYMQAVQNEADIVVQQYINALPLQQRGLVDRTDPIFIGALFHLVSQKLGENIIPVDEITSLADCSKHQLVSICNKVQLILQQKNSSIASDGHAATPPIIKTTNIPSRSAMRTSSSVKASLQYVAAIAPKDTPLCVKSATNADIKVVTSETINHQPLVEDVPSKKTVDNRKREAYEAWKAEQLCKKQC